MCCSLSVGAVRKMLVVTVSKVRMWKEIDSSKRAETYKSEAEKEESPEELNAREQSILESIDENELTDARARNRKRR